MTAQHWTFIVLAFVTLSSAYMVVTARLITHAALFLVLSFTAVAGIFLQMHQEFIAAIQVLIYAGAITTMIMFAIMLSEIREIRPEDAARKWGWLRSSTWVALGIGAAFALFMASLYRRTGWDQPVSGASQYPAHDLGRELFSTFVLPFEVASLILLVAMIGAIILTAREVKGS